MILLFLLTFSSNFSILFHYGALAQLGERLNGIQEASGSIPLCSTLYNLCGSNSVGRVSRCQRDCRGFESRLPLQIPLC